METNQLPSLKGGLCVNLTVKFRHWSRGDATELGLFSSVGDARRDRKNLVEVLKELR